MYRGYDFELCVCSLRSMTYSGTTAICFSVYALGKNAGRLIYRPQTSLEAPRALIADYMHFARWYYNHTPSREWDEHDYSRYQRLITYQSHNKNQPTRHQETNRNHQEINTSTRTHQEHENKPTHHYTRRATKTKLENREKQQARMPNTVWASSP